MTMQDLSSLLSRNLTLSEISQASASQSSEISTLHAVNAAEHGSRPITYSISQHYHHSAHLAAPPRIEEPQPSNAAIVSVLLEHHIDPMSLLPSQFTLFQQAGPDQQLRLLELWRISPPSPRRYGSMQNSLNHPVASMEQEEAMARSRYEEWAQTNKKGVPNLEETQSNDEQMDQDYREQNRLQGRGEASVIAEPYILSGYESLSRRDYLQQALFESGTKSLTHPADHEDLAQMHGTGNIEQYSHATEPVYQHPEMWQKVVGQQPIEHRYGVFDRMSHGGVSPNVFVGMHEPLEDEEML